MSTMGTFDAFTSARLGIYAAQHGFRVTGNNISNINTVGYTRQRLDQVSFKAGAYDRYRSQLDNHVGSGALVMNINQVRDPTLDVRYRDVNASVGYNDEMLEGLERIASIFDEVGVGDDTNVNKAGDGRLHAQIQAVLAALRQFSANPTKTNNDLVRGAASTMCEIINTYARELETLRVETEQKFSDELTEINECLTNIRNLNEEIRDNEIFGDNALELRDERNRQIDKLSEYLHISVTYSYEDVGAGKQVEKLTIRLDDSNPDPNVHSDEALLIDGIYGAQINSPKTLPMANPDYDPYKEGVKAGDKESFRYLQQAKNPDGIPWYQKIDDPTDQILVPSGEPVPEGYEPVVGGLTNDPDEAVQVENDYYNLQISKLVDQRNREWEGIHTNWTDVPGASVGKKAIYTTTITTSKNWADGDTFQINGATYTIGPNDDITKDDMNDPAKLAAFIAEKLSGDTTISATYDVTAASGGTIKFTAKDFGPQTEPTVNLSTTVTGATITQPTFKQVQEGVVDNPPADYPGKSTLNPDGSEVITSYAIVDGAWMMATTIKEHTYELTLDDNDTYGSLQAIRELLTEAGEFTTTTVRDTIDENGAKKRGIPYYQNSLDLFARQLATEYNRLNQGHMVDQDGNPVTTITGTIEDLKNMGVSLKQAYDTVGGFGDGYYVDGNGNFIGKHSDPDDPANTSCLLEDAGVNINDTVQEAVEKIQRVDATFAQGIDPDDVDALTEALNKFMADHGVDSNKTTVTLNDPDGIPMGGLLFSNRNDRDSVGDPNNLEKDPYITAANITISHSWSTSDVQLVPKYDVLWNGDLNNSSQNTNADHMVTMLDKDNVVVFDPTKIVEDAVSNKLFSGSFGEMFNNMSTILGEDTRKVTVNLNMYYTQSIEIDTARDGVSGVDLNDEAMNLMQFQKAYSAACRLMTVVDEALDRLINNTGVAGR